MRPIPIAILACVAGAVLPPTVAAAPALDGTFTPTGTPGQIARGPDGNVWFALSGSSANKEFGRIAPDGTITEYDTPNNLAVVGLASGPSTAGGSHDRIWLTQEGAVTRWDPAAGSGTAHTIATLAGPRDISAGGDGNMWAVAVDRVVKIGPDGTKLGDFLIGQVSGRGIARGSDGRMYLADFGSQAVQAFTTANPNSPQKIDLVAAPQEIEPGPSGQLAVSLPNSHIGRVSTGGTVETTTDSATDPFGITFGNDGAYWIALFTTHTVARLAPDGGYTKPIALPPGTGPRYIAAGANDTVWVTGETSKKIHRITGVAAPPPPPPPDGDADGVPDSSDQCPQQPAQTATGCPDQPPPLGPTDGDDLLNGDDLANVICGLLGNDMINGLGGNDTLWGDACNDKAKRLFGAQAGTDGNDKLNGGDGNDALYGAGGKDKLKGGKGKDKLFGGDGNDSASGEAGNDNLKGGKGKDTLSGGDGNDALSGEAGKDSLDGGKGNDTLTGGAEVNTYKGGAGNDTLNARNGKKETVDCGSGTRDKATVDRADVVRGCETVARPR